MIFIRIRVFILLSCQSSVQVFLPGKQTPSSSRYFTNLLSFFIPTSTLISFFLSSFCSGCRMYVALFPCNECAKLIIQSGVKDVIYVSDKYHDDAIMIASRRLFDLAGVSALVILVIFLSSPFISVCNCQNYVTAHFLSSCPATQLWHPHNSFHQQVRYRQHVPKASHITIDFSKAC